PPHTVKKTEIDSFSLLAKFLPCFVDFDCCVGAGLSQYLDCLAIGQFLAAYRFGGFLDKFGFAGFTREAVEAGHPVNVNPLIKHANHRLLVSEPSSNTQFNLTKIRFDQGPTWRCSDH